MEVRKIAVIGAGTMGSGIVQLCAQNGFEVVMRDMEERFIEKGMKNIDRGLSRMLKSGKITEEDKKTILGRIKGTISMSDLKDVDYVIEAVFESVDLKKQIFKDLDELTRPEVILSTNTSTIPITEIASVTKRPDKVIGMHFFNPPPVMRLIEIVKGVLTSEETITQSRDLAGKLGKETILVKKDVPGFVVNRLFIPYLMEAIKVYEEGIASVEDIDKAAKLGLNYPMGPFEIMDFTGLDIGVDTGAVLERELPRELKYNVPYSLKAMVKAGKLGRKSGEGWYKYQK